MKESSQLLASSVLPAELRRAFLMLRRVWELKETISSIFFKRE
jgi:hypothetical protein